MIATPFHPGNILKDLGPHRELLNDLAPYGLSPEEAWHEPCDIGKNGAKALALAAFKAQIALLWRLQREGLIP